MPYRGLVKWYDRGLQNLWWEFDSLIPCFFMGSKKGLKCLYLLAFQPFNCMQSIGWEKVRYSKRYSKVTLLHIL